MNTVNCISRISFIDGERGVLEYRGIPIEQLAKQSTFTETAFLLVYGQLPSTEQLTAFELQLRSNYKANPNLAAFMQAFRQEGMEKAHPMGMM